jgi:hypothetical protein
MDAFNSDTGMLWMTSVSHGKLYDNWALPGGAGEMEGVKVWHLFDEHVIGSVFMWLENNLAWVRKVTAQRISDEHASSGSDTDDSEGAENDRLVKFGLVIMWRASQFLPLANHYIVRTRHEILRTPIRLETVS